LLADDLDLEHISVGDIFRWNVQHHTKLGAQVKRIMASGRLVDDALVEAVVRERLADHDWNFGFVIDGFPRTARQAEFFLESYDIDGVINLDLPDEEVTRRVLSRRLCQRCGMDYNLIAHRPVREGVCDICQGDLEARADDNPTALAVRLKDFHEETKPLIAIFERKECVATIDATRSVEEVQASIRERFGLPPMKRSTPSRPFS
jgi:adenylate kinase